MLAEQLTGQIRSHLSEIKNIDVLINAFKLLSPTNNNFQLIIGGKGEEEGRLKSLVKKLNLTGIVNFTGGLSGSEIIKYYNAADVFCLPSMNEGLPNVIVEALLCGTPVVASAVGEIPYIIKDNINGYTFPTGNSEKLKEKLQQSFSKNWNRQKLRSSVQFLRTEEVIKEYRSIYESIKKNNFS